MRIISRHALAWGGYITYEVLLSISLGGNGNFLDFAIFYALNIFLFYFNAEVVFSYGINFKKAAFIFIPISVLAELAVYVILGEIISRLLDKHPKWSAFWSDAVQALWRGVYFLGLSIGYWFFKRSIAARQEANKFRIMQLETERLKMQIEKDLAVSRMEYLQSQINPHFLFNTLNYIYNSAEATAPEAANSILLLSEIMHYALSEIEDGKVLLADEIAHIQRYIKLTQLRFGNKLYLTVDVTIAADCGQCYVPPLLLLTFIENMFKHGDLTEPGLPGRIEINCENQVLYLNTLNAKRKSLIHSSRHTGIPNAIDRLKLYYPFEDFDLRIDNYLSRFLVALKIKL